MAEEHTYGLNNQWFYKTVLNFSFRKQGKSKLSAML